MDKVKNNIKTNSKLTSTDKLDINKNKQLDITQADVQEQNIHETNIQQDILQSDTSLIKPENNVETQTNQVEQVNHVEQINQINQTNQTEQLNQLDQSNKVKILTHEEIVKTMSLDDIFINLNLIAKIEVGDKLYVNDKYINIDMSYAKSVLRWFYGIDRKGTIGFVRLVINKSFEYCDLLSDSKLKFRLNNDLKNSITGLTKIKQTYMTDKLVQAEIDVIIEDIRLKIESSIITK